MKKILGFLTALVLLVSCAAAWAEGEWAEERKAAREFTAGFTAALTDRDMLSFVMLFGDENRYVLGETTLGDLERDRWLLAEEYDGVYSLCTIDGEPTGVYLSSEHGGMEDPIVTMDAMFQEDINVAYCGFDGVVGIHADDPDEYWYPDPTGMKLAALLEDTGECMNLWSGLVNWLVTDFGAEESEEGIYEAKIALEDGRTLYVSSHDSQVRISLKGFY